jgi:DtxR family Mn-dependent transcriptional regulator
MSEVELSAPTQDYLKAIYCLEKEADGVSASRLALALEVTLPSVTSMLKKLASLELVSYIPYLSIALTLSGQRQALEIVRHHRLLETYLQKALGFGLDALHAEADRLEHAISAELEEKIDAFLGRPAFDPHGSPIPDREGNVRARDLVRLVAIPVGKSAVVRQITCRGAEQLRYLEAIGLVPETEVRVRAGDEGSGILRLGLPGRDGVPLSEAIAASILVSRMGGAQ